MDLKEFLRVTEELPPWAGKLALTVATLLVLSTLSRLARRVVVERIVDTQLRYRAKKGVEYGAYLVSFVVVGRIWFVGFQDLSTFLGLLTAGLAVALQQPITNLAGFLFIVWRRPIRVGDRVEIAGVQGDVVDIRLFQTTLLEIGHWVDADQPTGRTITMPNGKIFSDYQANYTIGFDLLWHEIPVLVTFESDWRKAKELLAEIAAREGRAMNARSEQAARKATHDGVVPPASFTPRVFTTVQDSGVLLTLRTLCDPRGRRDLEERLWESILDAFAPHADIDFAYPTTRAYYNPREKKRPRAVSFAERQAD